LTKPKTKFIPKTGLLIPDTHIQTGDDLGRFYALKAWIASRNIELDFIVQIGDLLDFEALCTHDQDAPEWYERNLMSEIEAGMKALDIIERIGRTYGKKDCPIHIIEGNHENRYNKWMAGDNRLRTSPFPQTVAKLINFYRPSNKFNYVPFLQPLIVDDIAFSHYVVSGLEPLAGNVLLAPSSSLNLCLRWLGIPTLLTSLNEPALTAERFIHL